jgi:hypothetical protein
MAPDFADGPGIAGTPVEEMLADYPIARRGKAMAGEARLIDLAAKPVFVAARARPRMRAVAAAGAPSPGRRAP